MKAFRIATLGVALMLGVSAVASAQDAGAARGQGRGGRAGMMALMTDITITPELQAKIQEIFTKYQAETRTIQQAAMAARTADAGAAGAAGGRGRAGIQLDPETQKKVEELNAKRNAEIKALLTVEQQKTFDRNLETVAAGRRAGGQRGGAVQPPPPPPPPGR